ncbi:hypothetical protein [Rouxiella sp. WC2420]|uniref:Uncharacterized protein n=1 Tax=Rouxiella sp. WC2420 TaxID=3234145 RepID=A0AB39VXK7_9GAMM
MASDNKSKLQELQALKGKFVTGLIPNETDFSNLINLANTANTALGLNENGTSRTPLSGLDFNGQKVLEVKLVNESGLTISDTGLGVKAGTGVKVDSNGVSIEVASGQGIEVTNGNIIQVKPWPGVELVDKQLTLKVSKGLKLGELGIELDIGSGLTTTGNVLDVNIPAPSTTSKSGLIKTTEGLKINLATGDNNLTINAQGELTLTPAAIDDIKAGSKSKFVNALVKTVTNAIDKKIVPSNTTESLSATEDWDAPITRLVNVANDFGQKAIFNAKNKLQAKLTTYIKDSSKVSVRPTNDNLRINFSYIENDYGLYYDSTRFTLDTLASFWSEDGIIDYADNSFDADYGIKSSNFHTPGFYAFAGKLSGPGQTATKDAKGKYLTANAIMVYIGTKDFVYTVGYWDLSTEALEFYPFEAEPANNAETRKSVNLAIDSPIEKIISEISKDNTLTLDVKGGNGGVKKYAIIKDATEKGINLDTEKGILTFTKWLPDPITISVTELSTRVKNPAPPVEVSVKIKPIKSNGLTPPPDVDFRIGSKKTYEINLVDKIKGRDLENNVLLPLEFTSTNPSIVEVSNQGDITIKGHGAKTYIDVVQKETKLHAKQTCRYGLDISMDIPTTDLTFRFVSNDDSYVTFAIRTNNPDGDITVALNIIYPNDPKVYQLSTDLEFNKTLDRYLLHIYANTIGGLSASNPHLQVYLSVSQAASKSGLYLSESIKYDILP